MQTIIEKKKKPQKTEKQNRTHTQYVPSLKTDNRYSSNYAFFKARFTRGRSLQSKKQF